MILTPEQLVARCKDASRIVLSVGCFDVLHAGHIEHLRQAKAMGEVLVVGVTGDRHVQKGPGRPLFAEHQRATLLDSLKFVDFVTVVESPSAVGVIQSLRPSVYVKGPDYAAGEDHAGNLEAEREAVEAAGGCLKFTNGERQSSTEVIQRMSLASRPKFPPELVGYVNAMRSKHSMAELMGYLTMASHLTYAVVGEPIRDEYLYVTPMAKSAKDNLVEYAAEAGPDGVCVYKGGATIVAAHLAECVRNAYIEFPWSKAVVKRRYIERAFNQKLFSIMPQGNSVTPLSLGYIQNMHWDSLLVADFGHGLITPTVAQRIAEQAKWLGLTVQSNAANWGFNLLTKWPRADYVVLDEMELRLACTDRDGPLDKLMAAQMERLGATKFVVTLGHRGCVIYDGDSWHQAPALIPKPVDRMGAGDAFLAWSAPMAEIGAPSDVVALVGNIAGGVEAGMVGNQPVTRQMVLEWMQKLFTIG